MGYDCGFDIYPRLTVADHKTYLAFRDELISVFEDTYDEDARDPSGKILSLPTDPEDSTVRDKDELYIRFMIGECPQLPYDPEHCGYFLRFSSKISASLSAPAQKYIARVCEIGKVYFGQRVHEWNELEAAGEGTEAPVWYTEGEVEDAERGLRARDGAQAQEQKRGKDVGPGRKGGRRST